LYFGSTRYGNEGSPCGHQCQHGGSGPQYCQNSAHVAGAAEDDSGLTAPLAAALRKKLGTGAGPAEK